MIFHVLTGSNGTINFEILRVTCAYNYIIFFFKGIILDEGQPLRLNAWDQRVFLLRNVVDKNIFYSEWREDNISQKGWLGTNKDMHIET